MKRGRSAAELRALRKKFKLGEFKKKSSRTRKISKKKSLRRGGKSTRKREKSPGRTTSFFGKWW
jgi:hypothetical protein